MSCSPRCPHLARLLATLLVVLALDTTPRAVVRQTSVPPSDALQAWISDHAITVRSIDPTDEDFRDLEPLVAAIGSSRVALLGEPSHGAGSAFAAKVRLIKFLHRRMGFDVLAWESGFYDVRLAQAGLRVGDDPVAAAQRGILPVWSNAKEVRPLFQYVKTTQGTTRPLEMVGMDMNVSGRDTDEKFAADLRSFTEALRDSTRRRELTNLSDRAIAGYGRLLAHARTRERKFAEASKAGLGGKELGDSMKAWERSEGAQFRPTKAAVDEFHAAVNELLMTMNADRAALEEVHGTREVAFMERAIENMRGSGEAVYDNERADPPAGSAWTNDAWNRRDALMAENLRWWIQQGYPGRKFIVWAHSVHVMSAYWATEWRGVHNTPQPNGRKPAGMSLADWLKDGLYTIAMTTYQGEEAWTNFQQQGPIPPAPEGSLEWHLHRLGAPNVFLDLRSARLDKGAPIRAPQVVRVGVGPILPSEPVSDLTTAFDGMFYIDRMAPATPICRGPCAPPSAR